MRFKAWLLIICIALMAGCQKPQYKTRKGKKKQKNYNSIQYNKKDWDDQKRRGK